jgi:fimbrial chaperone protein
LIACAGIALAASFSVGPVRVFLAHGESTATLEVQSRSTERLSVQLNAVRWTQDAEGKDVELDTDRVVFFPRVFDLDAGTSRVIRLGIRGDRDSSREDCFRIYLQELASARPTGSQAVSVLLRIGVPIFLQAVEAKKAFAVERLGITECAITFSVANNGNEHVQVSEVLVYAFDKRPENILREKITGWYVLPGAARPYRVPVPEGVCGQARSLEVAATLSSGETARGHRVLDQGSP